VKALRVYGPKDLRLEDIAPPEAPGADEVVVAPLFCGLCGTDVREYVGPGGAVPDQPHPLTGAMKPLVLGHEFSARVVKVGANVRHVREGDRVAVMPLQHCGVCVACRRGEFHFCPDKAWTGLSTRYGGLGELAMIPSYQATPLGSLSDEQGALVEPAAVALNAVVRAGVSVGDTVHVAGCGPIGAFAILASIASGATAVYVSEPNASRAALGKALGATPLPQGPVAEQAAYVFEQTKGVGVDVAIDCAGKEGALDLCVEVVRLGGVIGVPGVHTQTPRVNMWRLLRRQLSIVGSQGYTRTVWDRTIALIAAGRLPVERVVTSTVPLAQVIGAFDRLIDPAQAQVKILIRVQ